MPRKPCTLFLWVISLMYFLLACQDSQKLREKLLQDVLSHYSSPRDSLKRKAATFLIDNMDGHFAGPAKAEDLEVMKADFLIQNIELAFQFSTQQLKAGTLTFSDFCEYGLPYRLTNEPLTSWRQQCIRRYAAIRDTAHFTGDPNVDVCRVLYLDYFPRHKYALKSKIDPRYASYEQLLSEMAGNCWSLSNLITYPLRALGVPTTTDFVPMWGNQNGGPHTWNTIITSRHGWAPFGDQFISFPPKFDPIGIFYQQRHSGKVFRRKYSLNKEALRYRVDDAEDIPPSLRYDRFSDVTHLYFQTSDIDVNLPAEPAVEMAYLATFSYGKWVPVYWAKPQQQHCVFRNMAKGLLYLPCRYSRREGVVPLGDPFYVDKRTGNKIICKADSKNKTMIQIGRTQSKASEETSAYGLKLTPLALVQTMDSICLNQKVSRPVQDKVYRLYVWNKNWQLVGERKKQGDKPLQFDAVPAAAVYRLLGEETKNRERLFTYSANQQVWW